MKCTRLEKPGVGTIHLHSKWRWVWRVDTIVYQPPGRERGYEVPPDLYDQIMHAATWMEAMALLRKDD